MGAIFRESEYVLIPRFKYRKHAYNYRSGACLRCLAQISASAIIMLKDVTIYLETNKEDY